MDRAGSGPGGSRGRASEVVAAELRRRIIQGEIPEGAPLGPERELLAEFHVSRPTMREALRVLDSESLLEFPRGSREGPRVRVPAAATSARYLGLLLEYRSASVDDLFTAVSALEAPCAGRLAEVRTAADLAMLWEAVAAQEAAAQHAEELLALQSGFHRLVVTLAGNRTVGVVVGVLRHIIDAATRDYLRGAADEPLARDDASRRGSRAHRRLVELIESGDAAGAEQLWSKQILATGARLRESGLAVTVLDLLD